MARLATLLRAVKGYARLAGRQRARLNSWLGMVANFAVAAYEFALGCALGNGYLCVAALYDCLLGWAKAQHAHFGPERGLHLSGRGYLRRNAVLVLCAGAAYGTYMGSLIAYPTVGRWTVEAGLAVAAACFANLALAIRGLTARPAPDERDGVAAGRRLTTLASALPSLVSAQVAINGFLGVEGAAFRNGLFGSVVGLAIAAIGAGMLAMARRPDGR